MPLNDELEGNTNFQHLAALGKKSCSAATLVVAAALLLLQLLQLFATSFSQQIAPPGRENTMALRDGMVPCNDNPRGYRPF